MNTAPIYRHPETRERPEKCPNPRCRDGMVYVVWGDWPDHCTEGWDTCPDCARKEKKA